MTDSEGVGNEIQAEDLEGDLSLDSERPRMSSAA